MVWDSHRKAVSMLACLMANSMLRLQNWCTKLCQPANRPLIKFKMTTSNTATKLWINVITLKSIQILIQTLQMNCLTAVKAHDYLSDLNRILKQAFSSKAHFFKVLSFEHAELYFEFVLY
jgi:hypothetical protein